LNAEVKETTSDTLKVNSINIDGEKFRYVDYKTYRIKPLKKGKIKIMPLTIEAYVAVPTNEKDSFGKIIYEEKKITLSTKKGWIDVK